MKTYAELLDTLLDDILKLLLSCILKYSSYGRMNVKIDRDLSSNPRYHLKGNIWKVQIFQPVVILSFIHTYMHAHTKVGRLSIRCRALDSILSPGKRGRSSKLTCEMTILNHYCHQTKYKTAKGYGVG